MKRAVVTGGHGFIGCHVVATLRRRGVAVTTLGRRQLNHPDHLVVGSPPWSRDALVAIFEACEPDVVVHLAGGNQGSLDDLEQVNVGLATVLQDAIDVTGQKPVFVCAGSATEYGSALADGIPITETTPCLPVSNYGTTKLAQTRAALNFAARTGVPVLIARIFNPIGPGLPTHLALGDFANQIARIPGSNGTLTTGNIDVWRDVIDVEHVGTVLWSLLQNPSARGIVNICSGEPILLRKLVDMLIASSGKTIAVKADPARLRPGELRSVVGSTAYLSKLGAGPPQTDYTGVIERLWRGADVRASHVL